MPAKLQRRKEKDVASYIYQKVKQSFEAQYYEQEYMGSFGVWSVHVQINGVDFGRVLRFFNDLFMSIMDVHAI